VSFMKEAVDRSLPIWNKCINTPFVQGLKDGTLPLGKFKNYIIQDDIYLKHYARVYGGAIYHCAKLRDIQMFYSALSFVSGTEVAARHNYLKQFGLTSDDLEHIKPMAENQAYIDFMLDAVNSGDIREMLMAVLPCMLSYCYIFREIAAESDAAQSPYRDFIADYTANGYYEDCKRWASFADEKCSEYTTEERVRLIEIFEKAGLLELNFWSMDF